MTTADTAAPVPAYRPTPRDHAYVDATRRWLALQPSLATRTKLAELAGISRTALSSYEAHKPRMAGVRAQLAGNERRDVQWEHILDRAYWRALAGDVQWALFFAKASGRMGLSSEGQPLQAEGPTIVHVHVPRPELLPAPGDYAKPVQGTATLLHTDVLDLTRR
jgi:hypothetical protein